MKWFYRNRLRIALLVVASLCESCATTKVVATNAQRVYNGQPVDQQAISQAIASDTKDIGAELQVMRRKFAEELTLLKSNVQKRWGEKDTKVADRTMYVKYTQGYKSRVVTDFDHGTFTVETVDEQNAQASLKAALISALLTSNDPAAVDVFTDKDVAIDAKRRPYLYGLVLDNHGKSIRTREQAEAFAEYLVVNKMQSRQIKSDQGAKTTQFVTLIMVKNFEAKGADRYRSSVEKYSAQYNVSPSLVLAVIRTESNFNPFAVSGAPAYGLMQLVPTSGGRAALKRVQGVDETPTPEFLLDPEHNIELGSAYLGMLNTVDFQGVNDPQSRDYCVIAAYNTGARNVTRTFSSDKAAALASINALPPAGVYDRLRTDLPYEETRHYVVAVSGYRKQFVAAPAAPAVPAASAAPAAPAAAAK
jgi:membrane-bound lytic murein transglycosylase C